FLTSGPTVAIVLEGREAIQVVRGLMGPTDGTEAAPATIRGDFALSKQNNLIHGSDNPENAAPEIALWFKPEERVHYGPVDQDWITGCPPTAPAAAAAAGGRIVMSAPATEPRNPFYMLLLLSGLVFVMTALAYAFIPILEQKATDAGQPPPPS